MSPFGFLPFILFFVLLALPPFIFGELFSTALMKLRLSPQTALLVISIGGAGRFDGIVLSGIVAAYLA